MNLRWFKHGDCYSPAIMTLTEVPGLVHVSPALVYNEGFSSCTYLLHHPWKLMLCPSERFTSLSLPSSLVLLQLCSRYWTNPWHCSHPCSIYLEAWWQICCLATPLVHDQLCLPLLRPNFSHMWKNLYAREHTSPPPESIKLPAFITRLLIQEFEEGKEAVGFSLRMIQLGK